HLPETVRGSLGEILETHAAFDDFALRAHAFRDIAHHPKLTLAVGHVETCTGKLDRKHAAVQPRPRKLGLLAGRIFALRNPVGLSTQQPPKREADKAPR